MWKEADKVSIGFSPESSPFCSRGSNVIGTNSPKNF